MKIIKLFISAGLIGIFVAYADISAEKNSSGTAVSSTTAVESSLKEQYISKVLIEAKWGDKPGEFAYTMREGSGDWPKSFVVDKDDNIFILDHINNQIQKFDKYGRYVSSIPIESYRLSTKEEKEESKKTWNKLGVSFPVIHVDEIKYIDGIIYAYQSIRKSQIPENRLLKMKDRNFDEVTLKNEINDLKKYKFTREQESFWKEKFKDDKNFSLKVQNSNDKKYEWAMYDGKKIREFYYDKNHNLYIRDTYGSLRKYNPKGDCIFALNVGWMKKEYVSEKGDIYVLELYALKKQESYSIDDYDGIRITKWSLVK